MVPASALKDAEKKKAGFLMFHTKWKSGISKFKVELVIIILHHSALELTRFQNYFKMHFGTQNAINTCHYKKNGWFHKGKADMKGHDQNILTKDTVKKKFLINWKPQFLSICLKTFITLFYITNNHNYWVFGLYPLSGILQTRKYVSETGSVSVFRWRATPILLGPLWYCNPN
jgi:hypothetical protein